jgi:acetyl-CoA synthetase
MLSHQELSSTEIFQQARQVLLNHRTDYEAACKEFHWPKFQTFNWAIDWFDHYAKNNARVALHIVRRGREQKWHEEKISFQDLSEKTSRIARHFQKLGMKRGDRLLVMIPNIMPLWETCLAALKIGVLIIPTATQATETDLEDRMLRGQVQFLLTDEDNAEKVELCTAFANVVGLIVGAEREGWNPYEEASLETENFIVEGISKPDDPLLLYFTSGTTAKPKLVLHTQQSYPVGHLSTMYWIGVKEGDVHQNISSPGWAKHAWSSLFAPWNAGATILVHDFTRFNAKDSLEVLSRFHVNTLCAPPTVWRMLILEELGTKPPLLHELVGAGEPLNPEVIETVEQAWGLRIRDGFGQTETTLQIGNTPGQKIKLGSMGRPLPGYDAVLLNSEDQEVTEGEISLKISQRPTGLMVGYVDDPARTALAMANGYYRTGDEATLDEDGYFHYVGRGDDVFKSSDYRISPFELESVLIEHDFVVEAAVIPSPHAVRMSVPKAFVLLREGIEPNADTAKQLFEFCQQELPNFKHIRRIEFAELPKTISGKIRRVQLRAQEKQRIASETRGDHEFWIEDLK